MLKNLEKSQTHLRQTVKDSSVVGGTNDYMFFKLLYVGEIEVFT